MAKTRLDVMMTELGLTPSRSLAQRLVMEGKVRVNGQIIWKPSETFTEDVQIEVEQPPRFASRGGDKLAAALEAFPIDWRDKTCADVGSSTGGFTDCLLQHGVSRVYAIDVGDGILDWRLRNDPRVVVMEKTNARYLSSLAEPVFGVSMDVSFISVKVLLPVIRAWFPQDGGIPLGELLMLIKPQFEAGRKEAAKGKGVIRDQHTHRRILEDVLDFAQECGYALKGVLRSPVVGQKGNIEFLAWLAWGESSRTTAEALVAPLFGGKPAG